jgi:hypothetical protein
MPNVETATRDWTAHYRSLTTPELVARTLSLRIAAKRGHATEVDERFAALEAEQDRRSAAVPVTAIGNPLVAHEFAHREDEQRWATEQVAHIAMDDGEAIADLLVQVRRNWRLSREHRGADFAGFSRFATWSGNAATELETEYGVEVAWTIDGGWTVDFEAGWTESGSDS